MGLLSSIFGGGGSSKTTIEAPTPRDVYADMLRYQEALTNPNLNDKLVASEARYGPQYAALELDQINTYLQGIPEGTVNPAYEEARRKNLGWQSIQRKLNAMDDPSQAKATDFTTGERYWLQKGGFLDKDGALKRTEGTKEIVKVEGSGRFMGRRGSGLPQYTTRTIPGGITLTPRKLEEEVGSAKQGFIKQEEFMKATPGMYDQLATGAERSGQTIRDELKKQRADDVAALEQYGNQIVEGYRASDVRSAALADQAAMRAGEDPGLVMRGRYLMDQGLQDASFNEATLGLAGYGNIGANMANASGAEQALFGSGLRNASTEVSPAGYNESLLGLSGQYNLTANRENASAAEQQLNKMGMSLSDLSESEQEALISGRGKEFMQSTGKLSALEQRRAQQSARQASTSRGRGMDQSALYGEMQARMSEELGKREREIGLGSQLLGQSTDMRNTRLGLSASLLGQAEGMDAQRRAEQMQKQQFGASNLSQAEGLAAQRRAEQLALQQFGTSTLGQVNAMGAQRADQQLQRQQFGSQMLGQAEAMAAQRQQQQLQQQQLGANIFGRGLESEDQRLQAAFNMNRNISGDLGSVILGRPSSSMAQSNTTLGQGANLAANQDLLFQDNKGLELGMFQSQQETAVNSANAQAAAAAQSGQSSMIGSIAGAALPALLCWVAREVYGAENPKWKQFRSWLLEDAPTWFINLYVKYGERFAEFISNKPILKSIIRKWMNTKIK
jgi:hypothetical protein